MMCRFRPCVEDVLLVFSDLSNEAEEEEGEGDADFL